MNAYVASVIDYVKQAHGNEPEFVQTVEEVLSSVSPIMDAHPEYEKVDLLKRMVEPERMFTFRVCWMDDKGEYHTNRGWRCQFNGAIGPYKGGIRFQKNVYEDSLIAMKDQSNCDFGKHIIPYCHENGKRLFAYEFNGYWKDVGTLSSYWEANMELIDLIPEFNLYEEYWKIYTKSDNVAPQYLAAESKVDTSIIGEGAEIYGEVQNSVIGAGVRIEKGAVVHNSIIMKECVIGENTVVEKSIIADKTIVGANCHLGVGEYAPSTLNEKVYASDLVTIGEDSVIPDGVSIGKNTAISGVTEPSDYPDGMLAGGGAIIKEGDRI